MTVKHIVLFEFKPGTDAASKKKLCDAMFALKDKCAHPTTKKPYVVSISGGKDMSVEGMQHGHTHAFVVEFDSIADRDHYAKEDAAHQAFIVDFFTGPEATLKGATVLDFVPDEF
ncbi:hypothetical protein CDD81_1711 [Ophiocordyceps australis]|uniref:Stress-response A/B barrel domain-containing protein n=1 Tax=Ophiocordyceps australis TaxID=1399860 RepID=A0A2C5XF75_9HYPO|nr:hypothetical protein CDD81_1711 [Ophiocordyceps australis]